MKKLLLFFLCVLSTAVVVFIVLFARVKLPKPFQTATLPAEQEDEVHTSRTCCICGRTFDYQEWNDSNWQTIKDTIHAIGIDIGIYTTDFENEYISLTDIAKYKSNDPNDVIKNWMRGRETLEFLGLWENLHNPDFKPVHNVNHANVLSGLLKCPCCGKGMYANVSKPGNKDNKSRYYYYCKNTRGTTGHRCTYRNSIEQSILDKQVSAIISAIVNRQDFKDAIKEKIGSVINTEELDKQLELLKEKQRKILGTKTHLQLENSFAAAAAVLTVLTH